MLINLWMACLVGLLNPSWKTDSATVILHRAAGMAAPENTWPALVEAVRQGADGVEIDVRKLADGSLVLHHDDWLPATPYGPGRSLETLPAPFARAIPIGRRWGSKWANEAMPELEPVLQFAVKNNLRLFLDLKTPGIVRKVETLVNKAGARRLVVAVGGTGSFDGLKPLNWVKGWNYTDGGEEDPVRMSAVFSSASPDAAFMVDDARSIVMALRRSPEKRQLRRQPQVAAPDRPFVPPLPKSFEAKNGWILTLRPRELSTEALVRLAETHGDPQVRLDAVMALGNGAHIGAIPRLEKWFARPEPKDPLRDPIGRPYYNTYLRTTIACALAAMPGPDSRKALERLAALPVAFASEAIVTGLAARGRQEDLPTLARLVHSHPATAGFALSFIGRFDAQAWPVLAAALRASGQNRRQAVFMIAQVGDPILDRLVRELSTSNGDVQRSFAWALYWIESPRASRIRRELSLSNRMPADIKTILNFPRPHHSGNR